VATEESQRVARLLRDPVTPSAAGIRRVLEDAGYRLTIESDGYAACYRDDIRIVGSWIAALIDALDREDLTVRHYCGHPPVAVVRVGSS
jgi:hypothetical protein